jgi:SpoU rRNA Methylase family
VCLSNDVEHVVRLLESKELQQQPHPFRVILGSEETLSAVAGFTVSRGCLACGYVPMDINEDWFFRYVSARLLVGDDDDASGKDNNTNIRLLALDGISDTANLGSMIRTASALGIHVIVLSDDSCDAWYRRSIRVSMGHIFRIPIVRVRNLERTLLQLVHEPYNVTTYAAVVDPKADILLNELKTGICAAVCVCVLCCLLLKFVNFGISK